MHTPDDPSENATPNLPVGQSNGQPSGPPAHASQPPADMLGALDIVEAFTALRQELKLQVRSGRESQQLLSEGLQRIEQSLATATSANTNDATAADSRKLAEAIADIDESLHRAVESLARSAAAKSGARWLERFDAAFAQAPWLARRLAAGTFSAMRGMLEEAEQESLAPEKSQAALIQGFELLLARVRRQMQLCGIERVDVLHRPFDAESMNAIDLIDAPSVTSTHVAEQLRPGYRWRGGLLRYAEVRLAK